MKYSVILIIGLGGILRLSGMNQNQGGSGDLNEKPIIVDEKQIKEKQEHPFDENSIKPKLPLNQNQHPTYRPSVQALPPPVLMNVYGFGKLTKKKKKTLIPVLNKKTTSVVYTRSGTNYLQDMPQQFSSDNVIDMVNKLQDGPLDANSLLSVLSGMNNNILEAISGSLAPVEQSVDGIKSAQPTTTNKVITEIARPAITTVLVMGVWILCKYFKVI